MREILFHACVSHAAFQMCDLLRVYIYIPKDASSPDHNGSAFASTGSHAVPCNLVQYVSEIVAHALHIV